MLKELLFWSHIGVICGAIAIGFFLSLPIVITLIVLHRMHVITFRGCLFSRLQKRLRALPAHSDFLQVASYKLFRTRLSKKGAQMLDYSLAVSPLCIAFVRHIFI